METVLAPIVRLLMLAIEAAVVGGAFAFGAWVVWRLLEQRRSSAPTPPSDHGIPMAAVFLALSLVGAAIFAFGARSFTTAPLYAVSFIPFLVFALLGSGLVWLTRRALRGR